MNEGVYKIFQEKWYVQGAVTWQVWGMRLGAKAVHMWSLAWSTRGVTGHGQRLGEV